MSKKKSTIQIRLTESEYRQAICEFRLPRYEELPQIELFMGQMLEYITSRLELVLPVDDEHLTAYMVNNYVKQSIVPKPKSKRYQPNHVAYLIVVAIAKQSFSIPQITELIKMQIEVSEVPHAYNLFCSELETRLRSLFCGEEAPQIDVEHTPRKLLEVVIATVANKIYVERMLAYTSADTSQKKNGDIISNE